MSELCIRAVRRVSCHLAYRVPAFLGGVPVVTRGKAALIVPAQESVSWARRIAPRNSAVVGVNELSIRPGACRDTGRNRAHDLIKVITRNKALAPVLELVGARA